MKWNFIKKIFSVSIILTILCTLAPITALAEWVNDYQGNQYYTQGNKKVTGWKRIDGQLYYFDENGKMQTGWIKAGSSWYFLQSNGALKTEWIKYNGNHYYSDLNGVMQTGTISISGKVYIFDDNGVMKTSNTVINGKFYTIGLNGEVVGNSLPNPDKEFNDLGECINVSKNSNNKSVSPTYSKFNDVIEDESDSDDDYYYGLEYEIEYRDNNGEKLKTKTVRKGKTVELYTPSKDGYKFVQWNTKSDGSGSSYDSGEDVKVNKDLTLYAQWKKDNTIYVESITIKGSSNVAINKTAQMTATVSPSDSGNKEVTWLVENGTGSATIDSNGLLTGISVGTVTVKAKAKDGSGISGSKEVTVGETEVIVPVTEISVTSETGVLKITSDGGTLQMNASVTPTYATNSEVTWSVEDRTGSAQISDSGLLTSVSNGTVTVKAIAKDGSGVIGTKTITISGQLTTIPVENIIVSGANDAKEITSDSGTLQMSATILPSSATNSAITWSVENGTGSAIISSSGLLTALADGTVTVKAMAKDGSGVVGSKEIKISNQTLKITKITVIGENNADAITSDGGTLQMDAEVVPEDASEDITWSVEQIGDSGTAMTGKATISDTGLLTAVSNGTVKVIATSKNGTGVYGSKVITISGQPTMVKAIAITTENNATELVTNGGTKLTLQMYATISPSNATDKTVTWSVANKTGEATINNNGLLTAVSNGTVLVTVTANDGSGITRNKLITISGQIVKVSDIAVIGQDQYETITKDKGTLQMYATITPSTATNKAVKWSVETASTLGSSMTGEATIDSSTGLLTAVSNGTVKVIATAKDGSGITREKVITISGQIIKVTQITVTSKYINNNNTNEVVVNGKLQMSASILPANASNTGITWSISNPDGTSNLYATISTDGVLTGISAGVVTVTATAKDGSGVIGTETIVITSS